MLAFILAAVVASSPAPQLTENNIPEVVSAMTLEEKVRLIIGASTSLDDVAGDVGNAGGRKVPGAAGATAAIDRLGIPSIVLADGPAGLRISPRRDSSDKTYYCTGFPVGTLMASCWNPEIVEQVGAAMGNEVLEYGVDVLLAPGANIHRNPLCGRNFEYYSEDPVIAGETAAAFIGGVQSQGVGTSLKHYALNNQELNRLSCNSIAAEDVMTEIYLRNFEIAVRKSQPWTIMTSYNFINGVHAAENTHLITDVLRSQWGFEGAVMTDWGGGYRGDRIVAAGNDMIQPGSRKLARHIIDAVNDGSLSMAEVDACVERILRLVVKTPSFKGYRYSDAPDLKAHAEVSRKAAEEGIILLKHSALPIDVSSKVALFGVASYDFIAGGTGSGDVNKAYVIDLREGLRRCGFALDGEVDSYYGSYMERERARCNYVDIPRDGNWYIDRERPLEVVREEIISSASKSADAAVVTIGRISGESKDRIMEFSYMLSREEVRLIKTVSEAFHEQGKKLTVLLDVCGVVDVTSWEKYADDIVLCWLPGQEGGEAVANVLSGKVNPSGRLPMTFPRSYYDDPTADNFPAILTDKPFNYSHYRNGRDGVVRDEIPCVDYTEYSEGLFVGYRYYTSKNVEVQYPFGYGLSYSTFSWGKMKIRRVEDGWEATLTVKNTGSVPGKDVVEIYLQAPEGTTDRPVRELKAFAKTELLDCGKSQTLKLFIPEYLCTYAVSDGKLKADWEFVALRNAIE